MFKKGAFFVQGVFICSLLFAGCVFASLDYDNDDYICITGIVIDKETNMPIPHAIVTVDGHDITTVANGSGEYELWLRDSGDYTIEAGRLETIFVTAHKRLAESMRGYYPSSRRVSVAKGARLTDIDLIVEFYPVSKTYRVDSLLNTSNWRSSHAGGVSMRVEQGKIMNADAIKLSTSVNSDKWSYYTFRIPGGPIDLSKYDGMIVEYYVESPPPGYFSIFVLTAGNGQWYRHISTARGHSTMRILFDDLTRYWQSQVQDLNLSAVESLRFQPYATNIGQNSEIYIINVEFFRFGTDNEIQQEVEQDDNVGTYHLGEDLFELSRWRKRSPGGVDARVELDEIDQRKAVKISTYDEHGQWVQYPFSLPNAPADLSRYKGVEVHYYVETPSPSDLRFIVVSSGGDGLWYKIIDNTPGEHRERIYFDHMTRWWTSADHVQELDLSVVEEVWLYPWANGSKHDSVIYILDIEFF